MYSDHISRLIEAEEKHRHQAESDQYLDWLSERAENDDGHWDCLECSPPPEVLEDTPQ